MGASLQTNSGGGRGRKSRYRPMNEINVTPFVDVMLVLLIVFMVTAPLLTAGVPVDLPDSTAKPIQQEDDAPIEVTVTQDGKIFIGESEIERDKFLPLLSTMMEGNEDRRIYIRGDQSIAYGQIMSVIGLISGAGFTKVALITEPG